MVAFQGAVDLGLAHVETDVHVTKDGVVVCIHDRDVDRTTDGTGPVSSFTFGELQQLDAGYRHQRRGYEHRGTGVRVPSLQELATAYPDVRLILDLKDDHVADPLARLIADLGMEDRVMVGSFSDRRLADFNQVTGGGIPTSTGPAATTSWVLASRVGRGVPGPASALQVPVQMRGIPVVTQRLVDLAHQRGLAVHVWTVNDPIEMNVLLDLGVDGIVTDRPDVLKAVLVSRNQWTGP